MNADERGFDEVVAMADAFQPRWDDFQRDIERYLTSIGKRERLEDGFIRFSGYDQALELLFDQYLEAKALAPLVAHFRGWNWERGGNHFLDRLTQQLLLARDWGQLQRLWDAVLAKRRKIYNLERKPPHKSLPAARQLLEETLDHILTCCRKLGAETDAAKYQDMRQRVQEGKKA